VTEISTDVIQESPLGQTSFGVTKPIIGANIHDTNCNFTVWAPNRKTIKLWLPEGNQRLDMHKLENGYWTVDLENTKSGLLYNYELDNQIIRPDPASYFQPKGVFGPSEVVDHGSFAWTDKSWKGLDFKDLIFYEVHVGTFTKDGTFLAMIEHIKELAELGINAIELMPITQFSGQRNWGYDGVFPFALHNTYGSPNHLKALVNECHSCGVALFVDFVYNHLGPEGNCLNDYAPYFSNDRMTRWGPTINLDGPLSNGVRDYFNENTLHWLRDYHIDGIRLDAVLFMPDNSPTHFLQELNQSVNAYAKQTNKKVYMIAESGYNVPKVLAPTVEEGYGFSAQWLDDFQHALFALITGEKEGYYRLYGTLDDLIETITDAYRFVGGPGDFRRRKPIEDYRWISPNKFVVFSQNHDQVGNRLLGDRLISITDFEAAKLAAGLVLLSPYVPLLFMGEEYGEKSPFFFFADYSEKKLRETISEGRKKEFAEFHWKGQIPNPLAIETFEKSKINWQYRYQDRGKQMLSYYQELIKLRKLSVFQVEDCRKLHFLNINNKVLLLTVEKNKAVIIANFDKRPETIDFPLNESYEKVIDSSEQRLGGPGSNLPDYITAGEPIVLKGYNFTVYIKKES
jgi:maltooligosyltrehalose trehalohydrolase